MRLQEIKQGKGLTMKHRLMRFIMNIVSPEGTPEVVLTVMYHREFFGKHLTGLFQEAMRGASELSVFQREIVAAATSKANECPFCTVSHVSTASLVEDKENNPNNLYTINYSILKGRVNPQNQELMDFAYKSAKENLTAGDVKKLRAGGFSNAAIEDVFYIVFAFCTINRMANSLDFEIQGEKGTRFGAKMLISKGYKF